MTRPVADTDLDVRLRVHALTVVRQGADYLVGDPATATYIVLPQIGVEVLDLLRSGASVRACASTIAATGVDVDVLDFATQLCALGLAELDDVGPPAAPGSVERAGPPPPTDPTPRRRWWAVFVVGMPVWLLCGVSTVGTIAVLLARPALIPRVRDIFFLGTPVRSVVAIMLGTFALSFLHEGCHWLTARAEGVDARIRISRRMYVMVFETDLTRMWSLPRSRRFWPLLAGMAFDLVLLFAVLVLRLAADLGRWQPGGRLAHALAALTFIQLGGLIPQFLLFLRTDLYAVLATATGSFDLWRVTGLLLRRHLRLASPAQQAELGSAHPRDLAVARWFVWLYAGGLGLAGWFFAVYFLPATVRLVSWIVHTLGAAAPTTVAFWEASAFSAVLLSTRLLTAAVAVRDLIRRRRSRLPNGRRQPTEAAASRSR